MVLREMQLRLIVVACALGAAPAIASADEPAAPAPASDGGGGGTDQLTLPKGRLLLSGFVEIGLNNGAAFKPISITPDIWYGVTDEITAGLVHSGTGLSGFLGSQGDALCLTGTDNGCPKFYNSVAADVRYKLSFGGPSMVWAADGALEFRSLDPSVLALQVGAVGRWSSGPLAVELHPALRFTLTNRPAADADALTLPVGAIYALNPKLAVSGQTGIILPFQATGDAWAVPLSIGGHYAVTPQFTALAAFTINRLIAGQGGGFDFRTLTLGGAYAF